MRKDPYDILDEWSTSKLLFTAGYYLNQKAQEELAKYNELDEDTKSKTKRPSGLLIKFVN